MKRIPFTPQKDFLARLSNAGSIQAVSELIWNGLDAGSEQVEIVLERNSMDGLEELRVIDRGTGIYYPHLDSLFGDLGDSWKKKKRRENGRAIHGKKGQGRLKAFALGNEVRWKSTYLADDSKRRAYTIHGRDGELSASDPVIVDNGKPAGTEVIVSSIVKSHGALLDEKAHSEFAKVFAPYLSQYPDVSIIYDGVRVEPSEHQLCTKDIQLDPIQLSDGKSVQVTVSVVEWKIDTNREIHLCDSNGVSLIETKALSGIKAPGFKFTAYIKSDYFVDLDHEGKLMLDDLLPDLKTVFSKSKKAISKYFRRRLAERQSGAVERWKAEEIYPFEDKEEVDPVEEAERQVFDILAVNVESYLPAFDEADKKTRKFTFKLIAQALKQNPESVQEIISGVLNLKKEDQKDLAELMRQTSLTSIISTAKTVSNRLNFLVGLENLLFDKDTKQKLLERDQLHKILEKEAWIFDEEFALSGSEKRLDEVLSLHLDKLGEREDPVMREGDKEGRVDLMLSRVVQPRHDERDHLVVELKRPKQKITSEVLNQIESYAIAVAQDERFHTAKTRWRFIAVSNEMDEHARRKAKQRQRKEGLVFDDADMNIEVWAFEWTEIIANARARLRFINQTLNFEADRDSSKEYLKKAHNKYIPIIDETEEKQGEEEIEATDATSSKVDLTQK